MLATDMHVGDACDARARLTCTRDATRDGVRDSVLIKLARWEIASEKLCRVAFHAGTVKRIKLCK